LKRFAFLSLFLSAACDSGGRGSVPPEQLGTAMGDVMCARLDECCTAAEFMEQTLGGETIEECHEFYAAFVGSILTPLLEDSIEQGRVVYHPDRMGACFDAIEALSCSETFVEVDGPAPWNGCQDPFEGQVAIGGECGADWDCLSDFCPGSGIDFDGNITYAVCAEPPAIGMPCADFECGHGAYCEQGTCEALLADGSACSSGNDCQSDACNGGVCGPPTVCDGVD
jgi:hypothetical protein